MQVSVLKLRLQKKKRHLTSELIEELLYRWAVAADSDNGLALPKLQLKLDRVFG